MMDRNNTNGANANKFTVRLTEDSKMMIDEIKTELMLSTNEKWSKNEIINWLIAEYWGRSR